MNKRITGAVYEEKACAYLTGTGMKVLQRNYRNAAGEIDIVARDGRSIVFVEVKFRGNHNAGYPFDAVDHHKRMQIIRVARIYLYMNRIPDDTPVRFDVIGMSGEDIIYIRDAFDASGSVSG